MKVVMSRINLLTFTLYKVVKKNQIKVKFILVGIWNSIFGYLIFFILNNILSNLLFRRFFAYMFAMILGQFIATINAFILHKYITFKSKVKGKGIIVEFIRFCLTYVVTFCLSLILLPFIVEIIKIPPRISAAIVIIICSVISYIGHSKFSFSHSLGNQQ